MKREENRLSAQRARIYERLRTGPATNVELTDIGLRFGARIHELRSTGHVIDVRRLTGGLVEYSLG